MSIASVTMVGPMTPAAGGGNYSANIPGMRYIEGELSTSISLDCRITRSPIADDADEAASGQTWEASRCSYPCVGD
jgi:hypothetical protein